MSILRILVASVLGLAFIAGATHNARVLWRLVVAKLRRPEIVPFFPGIAGAIGLAVSPFPSLHRYAWVPLVLDLGCLPYLVYGLAYISVDAWKHSRINLIACYVARVGDRRKVTLSLFRKDFVIRQEIRRAPGEYGVIGLGTVGEWRETPDEVLLEIGGERIVLKKEGNALHQTQGYSGYEKNADISLAGLVFERIS